MGEPLETRSVRSGASEPEDEPHDPGSQASLWAERLRDLALEWRASPREARSEAPLAELWTLLNLALQRYARGHARRLEPWDREDVVDIVSDKALDLLHRLEDRRWDPSGWNSAQVASFLHSVARNGVVDLARRRGHEVTSADTEIPAEAPRDRRPSEPGAEESVDGGRCARAIVECVRALTPRARLAWILRVFHDMSSEQIGRHPEVLASAGGVDLILNRSRRSLRKCMRSRGFDPETMPAGTFAALWELIDTARASRRHTGEGGRHS